MKNNEHYAVLIDLDVGLWENILDKASSEKELTKLECREISLINEMYDKKCYIVFFSNKKKDKKIVKILLNKLNLKYDLITHNQVKLSVAQE